MAIEFEVEDGTGLTTSTSYVSVADFEQYWENLGTDYTSAVTYPDATIQAWLNEATQYADMNYTWSGYITDDDQALDVPRTDWSDVYGRDINDEVPTYLKNGVCELAGKRKGTDPEASVAVGVASKSYGPVSVSYNGSQGGKTISYPTANRWFDKLSQERGLRAWPS